MGNRILSGSGNMMNLDYFSANAKSMSHFSNCPIQKSRKKYDYCSDICNDAIYHTLEGVRSYLYYPYQVETVQNFLQDIFGCGSILVDEKKNAYGRTDYFTIIPERKFTKKERIIVTNTLRKQGWNALGREDKKKLVLCKEGKRVFRLSTTPAWLRDMLRQINY